MSPLHVFAVTVALLVALLVATGVSITLTRSSLGLCTTLSGKGSPIIAPGRGC